MARSLVFALSAVFALSVFSAPVEASVKGNAYEVEVDKVVGSDNFTDVFMFFEDGTFLSLYGGAGKWSQQKLLGAALWNCEFGADVVRSKFTGVQIGESLSGYGFNKTGGYFLVNGFQVEFPTN